MRFNENIAISTSKVLLVPYDAHHVPQYHSWMEDEAIREATASDRLTLEEEYENQISWRTSADKLTFILCLPLRSSGTAAREGSTRVVAGHADADACMVGDINLFLTPWEDDEEGDDDDLDAFHDGGARSGVVDSVGGDARDGDAVSFCVGEVDIMIASPTHRGKGLGRAAVSTFLSFIRRNLSGILAEYAAGSGNAAKWEALKMRQFLVRIKATNVGSIALFKSLGFVQRGGVNYFGEIEMVLSLDSEVDVITAVDGYQEMDYDRSEL